MIYLIYCCLFPLIHVSRSVVCDINTLLDSFEVVCTDLSGLNLNLNRLECAGGGPNTRNTLSYDAIHLNIPAKILGNIYEVNNVVYLL